MMGYKHTGSDGPFFDMGPNFNYFAGDLMTQDKGCFRQSVPFKHIAAANAAGPYFNEDLFWADLRDFHVFDPYVPIIKVNSGPHC
jgi:hypothetical protein